MGKEQLPEAKEFTCRKGVPGKSMVTSRIGPNYSQTRMEPKEYIPQTLSCKYIPRMEGGGQWMQGQPKNIHHPALCFHSKACFRRILCLLGEEIWVEGMVSDSEFKIDRVKQR